MRNLARLTHAARKRVISTWPAVARCETKASALCIVDRLLKTGYSGDYDIDKRGAAHLTHPWHVLVPENRLLEAIAVLEVSAVGPTTPAKPEPSPGARKGDLK